MHLKQKHTDMLDTIEYQWRKKRKKNSLKTPILIKLFEFQQVMAFECILFLRQNRLLYILRINNGQKMREKLKEPIRYIYNKWQTENSTWPSKGALSLKCCITFFICVCVSFRFVSFATVYSWSPIVVQYRVRFNEENFFSTWIFFRQFFRSNNFFTQSHHNQNRKHISVQ